VQRLHEQDIDGIDAEVLFPPVLATRFIEGIADRDAYRAINQAYNTFLAEDFCSVAPDRLIGSAALPVSGIDDAIAELERVHRLGLRSVTLHEFPNGTGMARPEDDRFWARLLELGMALSAHSNFGARSAAETNMANATNLADQDLTSALNQHCGGIVPMFCLTQLLVSGVFDRFPELQIYFAEVNIAYLPAALYYLDRDYRVYNEWFQVPLGKKPSEYVLEHAWFGAIQEHLALQMGAFFPLDRLMFGTDFPHSVGTFPDTRTYIKEAFGHLDEATRRTMLLENPARFYGLDLDSDITETPQSR
jgi:predicted TIM-barrel fold metal-dependent hydrolase